MSEKSKSAEEENWAVFPFDEAEDDARWAKLISETEKLEKDVVQTEEFFGEITVSARLGDLQSSLVEPGVDDETL